MSEAADHVDNEADVSGIAPLPGDIADFNGQQAFMYDLSQGKAAFRHLSQIGNMGMMKTMSLPSSPGVTADGELATRCPASWSSDNLTLVPSVATGGPPAASDCVQAELFPAPQPMAPLVASPVQPSPGRSPAVNWESPESTQKPVAQHNWEDPAAAATFSQEKVRQRLDFGGADEGEQEPVRDTHSLQSVTASAASPALVKPVVMPQVPMMPMSGTAALNDSLAFSDADSLFSPIKPGRLGCSIGSDAEDSDSNKESCDPPPTAFKQPLLRPRRSQEPDESDDDGMSETAPETAPGESKQQDTSCTSISNDVQPPWVVAQKQMQDLQTSLRTSLHAAAENPRIEEMKQQLMMNLSAQMQAELAKLPASPGQQPQFSPAKFLSSHSDQLPASPMKKPHQLRSKPEYMDEVSPCRMSQHSLNQKELPSSPLKKPCHPSAASQNSEVPMSALDPVYLEQSSKPQAGGPLKHSMSSPSAPPLSQVHTVLPTGAGSKAPSDSAFKVPEVPPQPKQSTRQHHHPQHTKNTSNSGKASSSETHHVSPQKVSLNDIQMTFPQRSSFMQDPPQNQQQLLEQMMEAHQQELVKIQHEIREQRIVATGMGHPVTLLHDNDPQGKTRENTMSDHHRVIKSGKHVMRNQNSLSDTGVNMQMTQVHVKGHHKSPSKAGFVLPKKQQSPSAAMGQTGPVSSNHGNTANKSHQSQAIPHAKHSGIPRPSHSDRSDRISPQKSSQPSKVTGTQDTLPLVEESRDGQQGHLLDSSIISSIQGDKRDTMGALHGLHIDQGQSSSTPLNARTQARTTAPAASIEIQSMETVRNHLANMLQMTNHSLPSNRQFDETKEDASLSLLLSDLTKDGNMSLTSNLSNPGPQSLVDLNAQLESLLNQGQGQSSVARQQAPSVLVAENHMLKETLEKERFRRKHLEKEIQQNQEKMLELQQQLAVAISTDRKKDAMIEQLDKTLAKVVEGWKQRESQKTEVIEQLQQENEQLRTTQEHQQGLLLKFEKELASTVDILSNERTQSTELAEQREKQLAELSEDRSHAYKLLELERSRFAVVQEERDRLSTEKAKFQDQLLQKIETLETERENWEEKENEYLQKIDEIMENHLKVIEEERNKGEKQSQLLSETQQTLTDTQREEHDLRIKLDTASREKESLRVEMGLLEARLESSKRKLEADLRAESEKQITTKLEEAHERQVKSEEEIRERHRHQIVELNQQHSAEMEAQLQQYHEDLNRREENLGKLTKDYNHKISSLKKELEQTRQHAKHVESQRLMTTQKVESMMKNYCNETLRLLQVTPAFNMPAATEGQPPVYTLSPVRPHPNPQPSAPADVPGQPARPAGFAASLPVPSSEPAVPNTADLSMPVFNIGLNPPGTDHSAHGITQMSLLEQTLDSTQDETKTFEEMFNAAIASTLANQSFTMKVNQTQPHSQPANQGHDNILSDPANQNHAHDGGAMTMSAFEHPTNQKSAFMRVQHPAPSQGEDPPSFLFQTIRPAHQEQNQYQRQQQDFSHSQHVPTRNPAAIKPTGFFETLAGVEASDHQSNIQFMLRERQEPPESDNESDADFNPMLEDLSIGTSHLDDTEWHPPRISHTSAGQHQSNFQQASQSHHQRSQMTDYSQMSEKFEEHESRQAELQRYVQMLLERSPGDTSVSQDQNDSQISQDAGNLLASVAESLFSPRRSQPGPIVFSGQGQSQGQSQEEQDARHGAFSKTVLAAHDTNAGAAGSQALGVLSPQQVGEISRLLGRYRQGDSDSSAPPVHELMSYLRDLAPTQPEKTPPTSPGQSQVPQRGPSQDLSKVKRNLTSTFTAEKKQGQKPPHQNATKAGSPKQSRTVTTHKTTHKAKHVIAKPGHLGKITEKKSANKKGPVWK